MDQHLVLVCECKVAPRHLATATDLPQAACFTVATLYYNQAVLNRIAETFDVTFEKASSVATLMQAGYASGLLFICPLGDLFPRRPFILALVGFTATMWLGLCLTNSFTVFAAISYICGATTVTP
jgi:predicted MFS family arabinose efflux permease